MLRRSWRWKTGVILTPIRRRKWRELEARLQRLVASRASFKTERRIKPLLKKPTLDTTDIQNYRPVSHLSILSKTLERAIANQLSSYVSFINLLDPHQSGFKKAHSTETALLTVTESLRAARASSLSSVLILLDLSAVFDMVNHQILLATLAELGIAETGNMEWLLVQTLHA